MSHDLDLDAVYVEVSSSEEGELGDDGDHSVSDSECGDALLSALLLSEHPHPHTSTHPHQTHHEDNIDSMTMDEGRETNLLPQHKLHVAGPHIQKPETSKMVLLHEDDGVTPPQLSIDSRPVSKPATSPSSVNDDNGAPVQSNRVRGDRGGMKTDSMSTLSSHFSGRSLESAIVSSVGMERLTCLGRVTSARVSVDGLELDTSAVDDILASSRQKKKSSKSGLKMASSQVESSTRYSI